MPSSYQDPQPPDAEDEPMSSGDDEPIAQMAKPRVQRDLLSYNGEVVARRFNDGRVYYGRVLHGSGETVLQGTSHTRQWVVVFEDGDVCDFTREELEDGLQLAEEEPPPSDLRIDEVSEGGSSHGEGTPSEYSESEADEDGFDSEDDMFEASLGDDDDLGERLDEGLLSQPYVVGAKENIGTFLVTKMRIKQQGKRTGTNTAEAFTLKHLHASLPQGNLVPASFQQAKRMLGVRRMSMHYTLRVCLFVRVIPYRPFHITSNRSLIARTL